MTGSMICRTAKAATPYAITARNTRRRFSSTSSDTRSPAVRKRLRVLRQNAPNDTPAVWRLEDRLTQEAPPQLALTRFTDPPDSAQRAALLRLVKHVRQEVANLAADYQLEIGEESFVRSTVGEFSLLWCDLEDSRPQKLQRYGFQYMKQRN